VVRAAITGAGGQLGRELVRAFEDAEHEVLALARPEFDITQPRDLERLASWRPDLVVNAAAWTDVDGCARDPQRAMRINGDAAGAVARAATEGGALMVQVSTNEVFDGSLDRPYVEDDVPNPINPYGASKLRGEELVAHVAERHLIVRTAWLFGGPRSFPTRIREAADRVLREGQPLRVVADELGNPTHVGWLASAMVRLASRPDGVPGIWHLAGIPPASRYEWAEAVLRDLPVRLEPITSGEYPRASRVPLRAVLDVARAGRLGLLDGADWRSVAPG
jgi:dTDP-4-dehydrorhamnose reductase